MCSVSTLYMEKGQVRSNIYRPQLCLVLSVTHVYTDSLLAYILIKPDKCSLTALPAIIIFIVQTEKKIEFVGSLFTIDTCVLY